jgi:hypothetical protein
MYGAGQLMKLAVVLGSLATVQAFPKFSNARPRAIEIRQEEGATAGATTTSSTSSSAAERPPSATGTTAEPSGSAPAAAGGLTDIDILQFALTLEHLEATFYAQGFQKFPDSDFAALGLQPEQITALKTVGETERTHVTQLTAAISAAGAKPVQQCTYNFGFTTAKDMVATARVLEAAGISAYLGAAPLVKSPKVLTAAAEIVTIEARHQTFIRTASRAVPVPNAFDTPLGPRAVFTLAAPFISACPSGSNLSIKPFPAIALQGGGAGIQAGQTLILADPQRPTGAMFCAFINQGQSVFQPLTNGACQVPPNLSGDVWMMVTKAQSIEDAEVLAGPSVILSS